MTWSTDGRMIPHGQMIPGIKEQFSIVCTLTFGIYPANGSKTTHYGGNFPGHGGTSFLVSLHK